MRKQGSVLCLVMLLGACVQLDVLTREPTSVWLLGEVHDNPSGHRQRFELLRRWVSAGWRPMIAMEQFDRAQQPQLDLALRQCQEANCVISTVGGKSTNWDWSLYRPILTLALQYQLPITAANLSRAEAKQVLQGDFSAVLDAATIDHYRLNQPIPVDIVATQREAMRIGHCNQLPESMLDGMVRAQIARDVWMTQVIERYAGRGVVLLAGNGHIRKDIGVPRWLGLAQPAWRSVGFVESAEETVAAFDLVQRVKPHPRPDPCAGLK